MKPHALLRVSSKTSVKGLSGSITKAVEEGKLVEIQAIGAGAVNQAIKACAKSRGFIASKGRDLIIKPGFGEAIIDGEEKTQIKLFVSII